MPLLDEVNCADSCEAVTALCELIDELLKDIQHLEPEVISARKANVYAGTNISLKRRPFWSQDLKSSR